MALKRITGGIKSGPAGPSMAERNALIKARDNLRKTQAKLSPLPALMDNGEPVQEPATTLDGLNAAVEQLGEKKGKRKNRLTGAELEQWKKDRARVRGIQQRQADAGHYVLLCFPTGGICTAFVRELQKRFVIDREGDLFLDGRQLAAHLGIALPEPEYPMKTSVALAMGEARNMPKVPKGYKHGDE